MPLPKGWHARLDGLTIDRCSLPRLSHENLSQVVHRCGDGDVNVTGCATRAAEVDCPPADEGVCDLVGFEEAGDEACGEA